MKHLLIGGLLVAPCLAANPQFSDPLVAELDYGLEVRLQANELPQRFLSTCPGDFDGDLLPDLGFIRGGRLHVLFAPGMFEAHYESIALGSSCVALPTNAAGTEHCLAIVGNYGLRTVVWNDAGGDWTIQSVPGAVWGNVYSMRLSTHAGGMTLVGLDAGGVTVRTLETTDTYWQPSTVWTAAANYTSPFVIEEYEFVRWDTISGPELAYAGSGKIKVRKFPLSTGAELLDYLNSTVEAAQLAAVTRTGIANDWLAVVQDFTPDPSMQFLGLFDASGLLYSRDLTEAGGVEHLVAADYDGDGASDLILSRGADYDVGVLFSSGTGAPNYQVKREIANGHIFPQATLFENPEQSVPGFNASMPAVFDVDNDGDMDIACPNYQTQGIWVRKEWAIVDQTTFQPKLILDVSIGAQLTGAGGVEFTLDVPTKVPDADALEVIVWKQDSPTSALTAAPMHHEWIAWNTVQGTSEFDVSFSVPGVTTASFNEILFVAVRQVDLNAAEDDVDAVYSAYMFLMQASDGSVEHYEYVWDFPGRNNFNVIDTTVPNQVARRRNILLGTENDGTGHDAPCLPSKDNAKPITKPG